MENGLIYIVENLSNKKKYIGQTTKTLDMRKNRHLRESFNYDSQKLFHKALRKYGKDLLIWKIVEKNINISKLNDKEIFYIDKFNTLNNGYNMTIGGYSVRGYKHSEITKKKISESRKGRSNKFYYIEKYGEIEGLKKYNEYIEILKKKNGKGKTRLTLFIEKHGEIEGTIKYNIMIESMRAKKKGKKLSEEHKKKIGDSGRGKKRSEEFKEKLRNRIFTNEHRRKIGNAHRGKIVSNETIEKRKKSMNGYKHSSNTKRKISESLIKRYKNKKTLI